jgi:hypothetical protein
MVIKYAENSPNGVTLNCQSNESWATGKEENQCLINVRKKSECVQKKQVQYFPKLTLFFIANQSYRKSLFDLT